MDKHLQILMVYCLAHDGYRRAGLEFKHGENALESAQLSEDQLAALVADPRLRLQHPDAGLETVPEPALVSASGRVDPANGDQTLMSDDQAATSAIKVKAKTRTKAKGAAE